MAENSIYQLQQSMAPVTKITGNPAYNTNYNQGKNSTTSFNQLLTQEIAGVKFSQHAQQRLQSRSIKLGQAELVKLNDAVEKAAQKGANESLVFMSNSNLALVVSVKNKTVITVMDGANSKENVFTNIDSAVIV
ncbi:TIGR02530 family flagellar biosynthesis protein [Pelosinus sp. UFO1]|uniref:TIGR02530 family flagellar biosynthesis protein n=1 Tax=Pelosinus sp. UFO1 TaxID=484770 RepID=UPI0004D1BCED|nr:TIGR02530 family flagellar biosynthesis protein [Pelosinus sp. UFO1]AIF52120.1 flagellar operon protein [Pelosinus sp. UFO1]